VMFEKDLYTNSVLETKAIIHSYRVLCVYPYKAANYTAYDYTLYLLALLKVSRLLVLEYALLLRAYTTLNVPWPARAAYADQGKHLYEELRPTYLQRRYRGISEWLSYELFI
jgi:hypothetical protein